MKSRNIKRTILGWSLVLLFGLTLVPQRMWHDWVAGHRDQYGTLCTHPKDPSAHLHESGLHCDCNHPVVGAPFMTVAQIQASIQAFHKPLHIEIFEASLSDLPPSRALRSPPVVA